MPTLRHRRVKLFLWLAVLLVPAIVLLTGLDALRPPARQTSVRVFSAAVGGYRQYIRPVTSRYIRCRFTPSCSHYAEEATRKYGIAKGSWLAAKRIARCQPAVPMGTNDPVP